MSQKAQRAIGDFFTRYEVAIIIIASGLIGPNAIAADISDDNLSKLEGKCIISVNYILNEQNCDLFFDCKKLPSKFYMMELGKRWENGYERFCFVAKTDDGLVNASDSYGAAVLTLDEEKNLQLYAGDHLNEYDIILFPCP